MTQLETDAAVDTGLVGSSQALMCLRREIHMVAPRRSCVLIEGETGTGKELVAKQIHLGSQRAAGPFVPVDCTTLGDSLFESQLFGHTKGAFTGADHNTVGFFRAADGGTLFFDEIGELPLGVQARLLRCIQERSVVPLGSVKAIRVDVRIVAATHRDLKQMVDCGEFREDLYYRLNVVQLHVPPLRRHKGDIVQLAGVFLRDLAQLYEEPVKELSTQVAVLLQNYDWPGNVRELGNAMEHAMVFCNDKFIHAYDLPHEVRKGMLKGMSTNTLKGADTDNGAQGIMTLAMAERRLIMQALRFTAGNQTMAAQLIDVERHRLARKIARYGLESLTGPTAHH